jgi:hypothetical protein
MSKKSDIESQRFSLLGFGPFSYSLLLRLPNFFKFKEEGKSLIGEISSSVFVGDKLFSKASSSSCSYSSIVKPRVFISLIFSRNSYRISMISKL